jgi:DNA-binding NtrC family response regulator
MNNLYENKKKVVVLDDIKIMNLLYKYCLEPEFEVIEATNFPELKNIVDKNDVVLIIMDYLIPGHDFDQILFYTKNNFLNAKRILISVHMDNLNLKQRYQSEFLGILSKPLEDYTQLKPYALKALEN